MKVEIWSDVVCPWCYVGKRNFDRALSEFEHRSDVEVEWRSYELDPTAPLDREGSYLDRLADKYGVDPAQASSMLSRVVDAGERAGIGFRFDISRPGNTFSAHRLLHLAKQVGRQHELEERLFAATFTEGRPIADPDTLVELAGEAGLDAATARRVVDGELFSHEVRADEREAHVLGVRGVPFFVFDRTYGVSGAQPAEVFADVLAKVWSESRPDRAGGDVCDASAGECST